MRSPNNFDCHFDPFSFGTPFGFEAAIEKSKESEAVLEILDNLAPFG